jgi:membrane associated rhomboid family serine protease
VEHRFGHGVFLGLYLLSGLAATAAQVVLEPGSLLPMIGASGAISGVLGAYLVLFPRNRVHAIFFITIVSVPAFVAIGLWILFQFVNGLGAIAATEPTMGGVAYGAHIGGFFAGIVLATLLRFVIHEKEHRSVLSRAIAADPEARPLW